MRDFVVSVDNQTEVSFLTEWTTVSDEVRTLMYRSWQVSDGSERYAIMPSSWQCSAKNDT